MTLLRARDAYKSDNFANILSHMITLKLEWTGPIPSEPYVLVTKTSFVRFGDEDV